MQCLTGDWDLAYASLGSQKRARKCDLFSYKCDMSGKPIYFKLDDSFTILSFGSWEKACLEGIVATTL